MTFRFKKQTNGTIYAFDGQTTKRLATYAPDDAGEWECQLNEKHELAEGVPDAMDASFSEYLEKQTTPTEETTPPAPKKAVPPPEPDPIGGTGSIIYMLWAAAHATDEEFLELYGDRLAHKPSFLPWIQRTEALRPFQTRAEKLLTA